MLPIWFCAGTAAELIKLFPVMQRVRRARGLLNVVSTGQSPVSFDSQWRDFGYQETPYHRLVATEKDLDVAASAAAWFARLLTARPVELRKQVSKDAWWVVHGDTLSTLGGAVWGRRLKLKVAHLEAGLRSRDLREPFPEELNRTLVGQLATLHLCPTKTHVDNLNRERARGRKVWTNGNTQVDAIDEALRLAPTSQLPTGDYGLVNIHRFETLVSTDRSTAVKKILLRAAEKHKLWVVAHETANAWANKDPSFKKALEKSGAQWLDRQPFTQFAHWVANAKLVIADSAGNQNECEYLGVPCLLLRMKVETAIERSCAVLSRFDDAVINRFLEDPDALRLARATIDPKPADIAFDALTGASG